MAVRSAGGRCQARAASATRTRKDANMLSRVYESFGYRLLAWLLVAAVALISASGAQAQQAPTAPRPLAELTRLADDVYLFRYDTYQAIFIVTDDGVIATDPISLRNTEIAPLYKAAIASVTDQ